MARSLRIAGKALVLASLALTVFAFSWAASGAQMHLQPGDRAVVFGVDSLGLVVREGPGNRFPPFALISSNAEVQVVDGPAWAGNVPWYLVSGFDDAGSRGWSAGLYLQPKEAEAPAAGDGAPRERTASSRGGREGGSESFIALVTGYSIQGYTATGARTEWGIIAVDPSVIPLGSKIQIDGYEESFVAADTGRAIKGSWIDIWFPSLAEARAFGTQSRRVTVLH